MAQSVVDDQGQYKSSCGYCRSGARTSISHGMYARQMTVEDYQDLIDRGWRRSGNLLYKPAMDRTCCPPYTIRLDVNDFLPNKEQKAVLRRMERYLNGDFEIIQAPKGRQEGGRLSDGREAAPGELKRRQKSTRKGKRDLEDPESLGRETEAWPALESTLTAAGSAPAVEAQSDGALRTGQDCPAGAEAGGHTIKSLQAQPMLPTGAEAGALQQEEKISAKPSKRAEIQSIKSQVSRCVAQMAGGRSVSVDLREVPQKVRRKMSKQKRDKEAVEDLVYTCNAAFLLAASLGKNRSRNKGAHTSSKMDTEKSSHSDGGPCEWSGADQSNGNESGIVGSSPLEIAEALAAWLQRHDLGDSVEGWRVEACRGHLNFYAPADWLESKAGTAGAPDVRGDTGKQASMSGKREVEAQAAGGAAAGGQPKRRKRFEMKMNRAKFDREEFLLYRKYQIRVHNDPPHDVTEHSYRRFLVETPLVPAPGPASSSGSSEGEMPFCGFGSFHQQYRIDGRLVAVGVVDILPHCLSSKYLFWDPDLAPLSLGKFSALKEIEWVQNVQRACPSLHYYYLGFYIHNCAKMRYKAAYSPSQLLCPLHYRWVPHSTVKSTLDKQAYADLCQSEGGGRSTEDATAAPRSKRADQAVSGGSSEEGKSYWEDASTWPGSSRRGRAAAVTPGMGAGVPGSADRSGIGIDEAPSLDVEAEEGETESIPEAEELQMGDGEGSAADGGRETGDNVDTAGRRETASLDEDGSGGKNAVGATRESDQGMAESDPEEESRFESSDESESETDMVGDDKGAAEMAAATGEAMGAVPLLIGGTIIPFSFFQQLGMLPPPAVRALVAQLQPYYSAVGPQLAKRLVYSLG